MWFLSSPSEVRTINERIKVEQSTGKLTVETTNGDVYVTSSGQCRYQNYGRFQYRKDFRGY